MRDGSRIGVLLGSVLLACSSAATPASEGSEPLSSPSPTAPSRVDAPTNSKPEPAPDQAGRIADLDRLCRALDHDYVDGTLSDYYAKLEPGTEWGRERLREGEESMTPGRLLQAAATAIAADLEAAELAGCRKLFDELDELE